MMASYIYYNFSKLQITQFFIHDFDYLKKVVQTFENLNLDIIIRFILLIVSFACLLRFCSKQNFELQIQLTRYHSSAQLRDTDQFQANLSQQISQIHYLSLVQQIIDKASGFSMKKKHNSSIERLTTGQSSHSYGMPTKKIKKSSVIPTVVKGSPFSQIPEIPKIELSVDQMQGDPIELLIKQEELYQNYGAVKLITPPEWNPPFCFKSTSSGITSRVQHLHKLKHGKSFKQKEEAYNVKSFKAFAQDFERNYQYRFKKIEGSLEEQKEHEYWGLVGGKHDGPDWKFKVTTEYAADVPVKKYGSGFPLYKNSKSADEFFDYHTNLFNLNNLYKSPQSILKIADQRKEFISGVVVPWVYMGMQFSTFCWHVEDLWVNSLNYNHCGTTKTWYIVPKKYKEKFDDYVRKKTGADDLLNKITYMLNPLQLIENGIQVYRADQRPGEYICTFFKAYHAGFSHGFNVGEAVNFISPKSLKYIKASINHIRQNKIKSPFVLPYEWLIYDNIQSDNFYQGYQEELMQEYKKMVENERKSIQRVSKKGTIVGGSQLSKAVKYDKNCCVICRNYQYMSSVRCTGCTRNYCYQHFHECCSNDYELVYREPNKNRQYIKKLICHLAKKTKAISG